MSTAVALKKQTTAAKLNAAARTAIAKLGTFAELRIAAGDANANGKLDVSLSGFVGPLRLPTLTVDLDASKVLSLIGNTFDSAKDVITGGRR